VINKILDKMEPEEKRSLVGFFLILIGAIILISYFFPLIYMLSFPFSLGTLRAINYMILGIVFILAGKFTLGQWRTRTSIIVLGFSSIIIGGILIFSTLLMIILILINFWGTSTIFVFWNDILPLGAFVISGSALLLHGSILVLKKQKNLKIVLTVIFISTGITLLFWVSRPVFLSLNSPTLSPFFSTVLYINLVIVVIASLIIWYFIINPLKKESTKLLGGVFSIILGVVIIIISILGLLGFYMYAGGLSGGGIA